ncbi:MAG: phage holin family protein [Myxococcota bacterium]
MIKFILRLLANGALFMAISHYLPGFVVKDLTAGILAAVAFGVVNAVVRPLLILISLPVGCLTLGLFTLVIDAAVMALTAYVVPGFEIQTFTAALIGWIAVSVGSFLISWVLKS